MRRKLPSRAGGGKWWWSGSSPPSTFGCGRPTERVSASARGETGLAQWVVELLERAEQVMVEIISEVAANARARAEAEELLRSTRTQKTRANGALRSSTPEGSVSDDDMDAAKEA